MLAAVACGNAGALAAALAADGVDMNERVGDALLEDDEGGANEIAGGENEPREVGVLVLLDHTLMGDPC